MKNIIRYSAKGIFALALLSAGLLFADTAQAYSTDGVYQYQIDTQANQTLYYNQQLLQLQAQIIQLQALLLQMQSGDGTATPDFDSGNTDDSEVEIRTRSASDTEYDSTILRGQVSRFNRSDYADVWFEYGTSENRLDKRTPIFTIDENDSTNFSQRVAGLRKDTTHYFRAVAEDRYEEKDYGTILSFETSDSRYDYDRGRGPSVYTDFAYSVGYRDARLEGTVQMNDFRDGEVFFVYGTDSRQVQRVSDDHYSYSDVYQDGSSLRKYRVDRNIDDKSTYEMRVTGLDSKTTHYFSLCVGYESERDDEILKCSSVRSFTTQY